MSVLIDRLGLPGRRSGSAALDKRSLESPAKRALAARSQRP
jgi:hypothetical protein